MINAPNDDLKPMQRKLTNALWEYQKYIRKDNNVKADISHGFEKEKGIITNAKSHRNKRFVLNVDLEGFFDSFHFGRVRGYFQNNRHFKLPTEVATTIAQLACYESKLPQGAPSSPIITNLICQVLDNRLLNLAKKYRLDYTRYADDLTFSTNDKAFLTLQAEFLASLESEIIRAGFKINAKKTRLQYYNSQQKVTGLVVNKIINVDRKYYKETKAMAHSLYINDTFSINGKPGTVAQLEGRFAFINQLTKCNNILNGAAEHNFRKLSGREKEYQKFLFYKYFFANEKPVIVTEGKTDIVYLRTAIKKYYADYPSLITRKDDGSFEYKISFLRRSKRLRHFFGLVLDGADAIKNLYEYFIPTGNKKNYPDYLGCFTKLQPKRVPGTVILFFDNELGSNVKKPLRGFVNHAKLTDDKITNLQDALYLKMLEKGNLYLMTNPLIGGKDECEIEDLFDKTTLGYEIGGKTFSRSANFDNSNHYGKEIFASHISECYESIDFSNFRKVLDNLTAIVNES